MRHRAIFQTDFGVDKMCQWFVSQLCAQGFSQDGEILQNQHHHSISVIKNKQQATFSTFETAKADTNICIYVEPKLGFIGALLRRNDEVRELATTTAHQILSRSPHISMLGWYTDTQVWRGGTDCP